MPLKKRPDSGFTLIELIIVMIIMGIGFMTLSPFVIQKTIEEPAKKQVFDSLISDMQKEAIELGRPVSIQAERKGWMRMFLISRLTVRGRQGWSIL